MPSDTKDIADTSEEELADLAELIALGLIDDNQ